MTNHSDAPILTRLRHRLAGWTDSARNLEGGQFDAVFTILALWMVGGVAWDFHTHAGGVSFAEEGF